MFLQAQKGSSYLTEKGRLPGGVALPSALSEQVARKGDGKGTL